MCQAMCQVPKWQSCQWRSQGVNQTHLATRPGRFTPWQVMFGMACDTTLSRKPAVQLIPSSVSGVSIHGAPQLYAVKACCSFSVHSLLFQSRPWDQYFPSCGTILADPTNTTGVALQTILCKHELLPVSAVILASAWQISAAIGSNVPRAAQV